MPPESDQTAPNPPAPAAPTQGRDGRVLPATHTELSGPIDRNWPALKARDLRPTEMGLVMLRGRIGGDGRPSTSARRLWPAPSSNCLTTSRVRPLPRAGQGEGAARRHRRRAVAGRGRSGRCRARDRRARFGPADEGEGAPARGSRLDQGGLLHARARRGLNMAALLAPGFADPVFDSQKAFPRRDARHGAAGLRRTCRVRPRAACAAHPGRSGRLPRARRLRNAALAIALARLGGGRRRVPPFPQRRARPREPRKRP